MREREKIRQRERERERDRHREKERYPFDSQGNSGIWSILLLIVFLNVFMGIGAEIGERWVRERERERRQRKG